MNEERKKKKKDIQLLIVDYGSQYTKVIGRAYRELKIRSITLAPKKAVEWLKQYQPKLMILSGGPKSVYEEGAPRLYPEFFAAKVPMLAICYGMQIVAQYFNGKVEPHHDRREYGKAVTHFDRSDPLFQGLKNAESDVWASHGDSVTEMPVGFKVIATPGGDISTPALAGMNLGISAMSNLNKKIWCLQFHPEVMHTKEGKRMLQNFAQIGGCEQDWEPEEKIFAIEDFMRPIVAGKKGIIGLSGGVDSSFLAKVSANVFAKGNLLAVAIDHGGLREGELADIRFAAAIARIPLKIIKATKRFRHAIGNEIDAEKKRKCFMKLYAKILDEEAKRFGASFILQGTLATDLIESKKAGEAGHIKSHHNTAKMKTVKLEPLKDLFKYEVRDLGKQIGMPDRIFNRQPFPGPGLWIRIVGMRVTPERLSLLRWADAKVREILTKHKLMGKISQVVVALLPKMTGVKGDQRKYGYGIGVRTVVSNDFMTCDGFRLSEKVKEEIERELGKHSKIVQVGYFEISKPPGTTEFE